MNTKYELLENDTKELFGIKLFRIKALVAIGFSVSAGDVGGYVQSEKNLSVSGDAWVYVNAQVYGNAWVYGNALVYGNAQVYGNAWVSGNAQVYGNALVSGNAQVSGDAWVSGNAQVYGNALVQKPADIQTYSGVGSRYGTLTVYRTKDGIELTRGCFQGSLEKFRAAVIAEHGETSKFGKSYLGIANLIEFWFDIEPVTERKAA